MHCRQWAHELVAYDSRRARTHLLSSVSAEVLSLLLRTEGGSTLAGIEALLLGSASTCQAADALTQDERGSLQAIVVQLTELGLLESRST